jgi:hypothetical protein
MDLDPITVTCCQWEKLLLLASTEKGALYECAQQCLMILTEGVDLIAASSAHVPVVSNKWRHHIKALVGWDVVAKLGHATRSAHVIRVLRN